MGGHGAFTLGFSRKYMLSGHWSPPYAFCFSCVVDLARFPLSTDAVLDDNLF